MVLKLQNIKDIFETSAEDGQIEKIFGKRKIPSDDNDTTGIKPDEYVVDAAGNGDYTTIADALTALGASSGTIRVLAGTYTITDNISLGANQTIFGSGYGTLITTTSNITLITLTGNRSSIFMCRIDGNNTGAAQVGIYVVGDECVIRNCWITQMGDIGILFGTAPKRTIIEGCVIEDCGDRCIELNDGEHWMISDSVIDNSSNDGIQGVGADFGSIIGCKITNNGEHGIDLTSCTQITIVGNYIFSNGDNNANGDGVEFSACNDCIVTGNIIHTNDGVGVDIDAATSNRTVVIGNSVLNNEDGQITDNGTSSVVANNAV